MAVDSKEAEKEEPDIAQTLGEYQTFIGEIFRRLDEVTLCIAEVKENPEHPKNWKNCDFCWFQIRKICEYLALAVVLVHHRDSDEIEDLSKWRPKDLLGQVAKLSDHPTPVPVRFEASNGQTKQLIPLSRPVDIKVISEIYGRCSNILHVGRLDRILADGIPTYDVSHMEKWIEGLNGLLRDHALLLPNVKTVLVCLSGENDNEPAMFFPLGSDGALFNSEELPDCGLVAA